MSILGLVKSCEEQNGPRWLRQFTFPASFSSISEARGRVERVAAGLGLSGADLFDLLFAVGEALGNAVKHGSPRGELDRVRVAVGICNGGVAVEISDEGLGFADSPLCHPDAFAPAGRGIPFMRSLTDDLRFECDERGTRVVLVKVPGR